LKPPANCKPYFYRVQVYDECSLTPTDNNPPQASTGQSTIFPLADATNVENAIEGYASSSVAPTRPEHVAVDYSGSNSRCNKGQNRCDVVLTWDAVKTDTDNPTSIITVDQYRISRERKKASGSWTFDTVLPVLENVSENPSFTNTVTYHDTTALDHDPNDRRKWYYRYTITALQCGVSSAASLPVQFPQSCGLSGSTVIESGASSGNGSLESPWVMGASDFITVVPPATEQLNTVDFEVFPEPDPNPNNASLVSYTDTTAPFDFTWQNQSDGQVYRVVITMTNANGCTEQTERFMQDDPVNCASATVTATGSSGGSGTEPLPWVMGAGQTDKVTVNAPSGSPIASVSFRLFVNPGNTLVGSPSTDILTPFEFAWPASGTVDNEDYRLEISVIYLDGCAEVFTRYILEEPPIVCTGATMTVTGASSGSGTAASPWLVNGGDVLRVTPPTNGIINQVAFTITPFTPAGAPLPVVTDSTSPFELTWVDRVDNTIYKVDAVITYGSGCTTTETVTRYVQDQVCSGSTVAQTGSTGAGTGLTTFSPWVFDANDTVTVTPPAGTTITNVQFNLFQEPGTTAISTATDATSPYQMTWVNRVDDALYRLEIVVTYAAGCSETMTRYIRDQGSCFLTVSSATVTNTTSGNDKLATITYVVTNPTAEVLTLRGIKIDWLRDNVHPLAVLESITYVGASSATQNVSAANGAPPTTGVLSTGTVPTIPASSSSYQIRVTYNLGRKQDVVDLNTSWINKLCLQYLAPSFGGSTASCNVLGATSGNPTACN
ncbi:MAG TPA: hypothetical protein VF911_14450, partial [Thermoanaerobaculia bacterium]